MNKLPWICPNHPHAQIRREWLRDKWYPWGSGIDYDFHYYCNECGLELAPPNEKENEPKEQSETKSPPAVTDGRPLTKEVTMATRDYNMDGESLAELVDMAEKANTKFNDYVNEVYENGGNYDVIRLTWLKQQANDADTRVLLARHKALNECTCKPNDVMACPVCRASIQEKLGDEIPY